MRKRVLSFLLAASAAFCFICSSAPEAQAIVPIGLVQSALASYVTSAGYKMWSENGGGELMVDALSTLYQSWLDSTDPVGALTLGQMSENDYVYLDNSGQIVIRKAAADLFQQFSDWIQTEYSVSVGSDTPTEVVRPSGGSLTAVNDQYGTADSSNYFYYDFYNSPIQLSHNSCTLVASSGYTRNLIVSSGDAFAVVLVGSTWFRGPILVSNSSFGISGPFADLTVRSSTSKSGVTFYYSSQTNDRVSNFGSSDCTNYVSDSLQDADLIRVASDIFTFVYGGQVVSTGGVAALGVTLAQAVADVVGQAKEDDAVVIGVGASAGATAQDIADMVAQGVKAQTLNPSVSITAEAVIDTPVQPYPDIDGLGLPTLGAALVDRFPFCIPWDFVDTVKLLSADPQPINIKVDLIPQRIKTSVGITSDTSFDIDLSGEQYAKIGVFCRWGSLITFCFGLFLLTKRLVWTA